MCAMEDVIEVYHRTYDVARPQVCLDETSKQLVEHTRVPLPASSGHVARVDPPERIAQAVFCDVLTQLDRELTQPTFFCMSAQERPGGGPCSVGRPARLQPGSAT